MNEMLGKLFNKFWNLDDHFVISHFDLFQEGNLTSVESELYADHLEDCLNCQKWVENQMISIEELKTEEPPVYALSPDDVQIIHQNVYDKMRRALIMSRIRSTIGAISVAAILIILVAVFLWWQSGEEILAEETDTEQAVLNTLESGKQEESVDESLGMENEISNEIDVQSGEKPSQADLDAELLEAIRSDNMAQIEELIHDGANVNTESGNGFSVLALAASKGNSEIVQLLIDNGADLNYEHGNDPLAVAARFEQLEIVKILLDAGADVESTISLDGTYENSTGMQWAAINNNVELAELLIEYGADVNTAETLHNRTPIHGAAYYNSPEMVVFLLENGADPERRDSFGDTPLHYAVSNRVLQTAQILIEHGVALDTRDDLGNTLLDEAGSNSEMIQLLQEAGVEE